MPAKRKPARPTKSRREINRDGQRKMTAELNELARLKGWNNFSEYRTAVRYDEAEIPEKKEMTE